MQIDVDRLPYKHRFAAASMLMSKGNRLTELTSLAAAPLSDKQVAKVREGLSYYDMALSLMKPHDPNYQTLLNWKCLALMSIGQYRDACDWYRELVRIDAQSQGGNVRSATANLALDQIATLEGRENHPLPADDPRDVAMFDDPPFCFAAESFCLLLRDGKFKQAQLFLSPQIRAEFTPDVLKRSWQAIAGGGHVEADLWLERYELNPPNAERDEIGWCYFVVQTEDASEAISLGVGITPANAFEIRSLEFGRP